MSLPLNPLTLTVNDAQAVEAGVYTLMHILNKKWRLIFDARLDISSSWDMGDRRLFVDARLDISLSWDTGDQRLISIRGVSAYCTWAFLSTRLT